MKYLKIIIEKDTDEYMGSPLGLESVVVGEGDSSENALKDVKSAIRFYIETFGDESPVFEHS